jgi:hypothetical protein
MAKYELALVVESHRVEMRFTIGPSRPIVVMEKIIITFLFSQSFRYLRFYIGKLKIGMRE